MRSRLIRREVRGAALILLAATVADSGCVTRARGAIEPALEKNPTMMAFLRRLGTVE